jgi:hypothetical protein
MTKQIKFAGYDIGIGKVTIVKRATVNAFKLGDYGADPLDDGTFRMVPSGDIVSLDERNRRLSRPA